jgi:hypothetical protein
MKFERIVLLVLLGIIVVGGFIADKKISSLENALANQQVDTVLVNIPLVQLDTVIVAHSDTVYADAVFLTGGLTWKKTYVGITRSEAGWGITAMREIFAW